jgi:hypothetical protein
MIEGVVNVIDYRYNEVGSNTNLYLDNRVSTQKEEIEDKGIISCQVVPP